MFYSERNGIKLYYNVIGEGTPILMIHGWGVDHRLMSGCFEPIFENLQKQYKRIYIDLPGMGQSTATETIHTSDDVLAVIMRFVDDIIGNTPFIVAGQSYGGLLVRGMVNKYSERIKAVMLLCPLIYPGSRNGRVAKMAVLEEDKELLAELNENERAKFIGITVIQTRPVWERFKQDIYGGILLQNTHFLSEVLDGAFSFDVDKLTEPFNKPCLIITGKQDTEVGFVDQFELLSIYPRASYVAVDGAGHNLQVEKPEAVQNAVKAWIKTVE